MKRKANWLNNLLYLGEQLRMNLKDAATLYPENFQQDGVKQLIKEWDRAVRKAREMGLRKGGEGRHVS